MILQIETATTSCSVALSHNGTVLSKKELDQRNVHAEVLTLFIQDVCAEAGIALADLDAVAVSSGPGSYTGLRIGVSTAKGLCFALDKPLIAVESLKAMADGMAERLGAELTETTLLCPMIDARRMEVFAAMFDIKGEKIMPTAAVIVDGDSFADLLADHQIIFFGDGAMKCQDAITHANARFINGFANSATDITAEATAKFEAKEFEDVAYFEPYYLKDFIAGVKKQV